MRIAVSVPGMDEKTPRRPLALLLTVVLAAALLTVAAGANASARCPQRVSAGRAPGITLRGDALRVNGVTCTRARAVVAAFLSLKLHQASERCAGLAETPPYRGCIVEGYRCRATSRPRSRHGRSIAAQQCSEGRAIIRFSESDSSAR